MAGLTQLVLVLTMMVEFVEVRTDLLYDIEHLYDFYKDLGENADSSNLAASKLIEKSGEPVEPSNVNDGEGKKNDQPVWNTRELRGKTSKSQVKSNERKSIFSATASTKGMRGKRSKMNGKEFKRPLMQDSKERQNGTSVPVSNGMNAIYLIEENRIIWPIDLQRKKSEMLTDGIDDFEKFKRALLERRTSNRNGSKIGRKKMGNQGK